MAHASLASRHAECGSDVVTGCLRHENHWVCGVIIVVGVSFSGVVGLLRKAE